MNERAKYLVLCVDDEKIILDSLKKELKTFLHKPYELEVAQSGQEALELMGEYVANGYEIPLVVTDYIMPNMRGDELLRNISQLSPSTFGILLTGQANLEGVRNSVRYGRLQSFLMKPWDTVDLKGDIQKTLNLYQKEKQIAQQNMALKDLNAHLEDIVEGKTQELILQNQKLLELNQEKDSLMGIVAHDLRSPINNIVGSLELMRLSKNNPDEIPVYFDLINKEVERAYNLIEDLLLISKYNVLEKDIELVEVDAVQLVDAVFKNFAQKAQEKHISLHIESQKPVLLIKTEQDTMERILENLLSNAIKFSSFHKNIWIRLNQTNKETHIAIQDEGQGFSEEDKKRIFQKFQKLSALPTGGESSTGLGLSIIKIFTEHLRGTISLESEQGKGSTFNLSFPLY